MMFKEGTALYHYEVVREGGQDVMYINYIRYNKVPSMEDSECFGRVVDYLIENPRISRVVFVQQRNYSYDFNQVLLLSEIAGLYVFLVKQENILSPSKLVFQCRRCLGSRHAALQYLVLNLLKRDPVGCYVESKRILREEKINAERLPAECATCETHYMRTLERFIELLERTALLKRIRKEELEGYHVGDREIYRTVFRPDVIPNFTFTRLMASMPSESELIDEYKLPEGSVTVLKLRNRSKYLYHLMPPEFSLKEEHYNLLDMARNILIEHEPKAEEFTDPERTRGIFMNIGSDLLRELADNKGIKLSYRQLKYLSRILVRHTIGFGLIEVLLQDELLQDIVVNAPVGGSPIFVRHQDYDECFTNIIPSQEDVDSWAAKFRMISGRPLDEANPVLDTDLVLGNLRARVAVVQQPLSPHGLSYAFRRHREKPWTLPLFIKNKMISSLSAGLMSFLIDGARTMLIAGTRSAGKTSLLGSLLLEIMPKYRVISIEDTLELPIDSLRELGYNVLRMKVRAALLKATTEIPADEGIRTSLRLGDSSLIIGEIRSLEAKALYEAMRIGALANVVAGTIHGASPYAVFDRVVNDLQVPVTSFKATDIIAVANMVRSADGLHSWRRLVSLTEVRKHWQKDPLEEQGFVDLLNYDVRTDELKESADLINGESEVLKDIAGNVKEWAGNWDAVWDNIILRKNIKEELIKASESLKMPELLEADFVVKSNNAFHAISDYIRKEIGVPEGKRVLREWKEWLREEIKRV